MTDVFQVVSALRVYIYNVHISRVLIDIALRENVDVSKAELMSVLYSAVRIYFRMEFLVSIDER